MENQLMHFHLLFIKIWHITGEEKWLKNLKLLFQDIYLQYHFKHMLVEQ